MDPISALGVAAAVVQFIDFSSKLIVTGIKSQKATAVAANESVHFVINRMKELLNTLGSSTALSHGSIADLASECCAISKEILLLLEETRYEKGGKFRKNAKAVLKAVMSETEKELLLTRLDRARYQLGLEIQILTR
jgi:hypothetical protein